MAFSTNRDLLIESPNLLREVLHFGQVKSQAADGEVSGTGLSSASADFTAAGVAVGDIVLIEETHAEITTVISPTGLTVSRLRADTADSPAPPARQGTALRYTVADFTPQIERAHRSLLEALQADQADITTPIVAEHIETLDTLAALYRSAAWSDPLSESKAAHFELRASKARAKLGIGIDRDGDGAADETVTLAARRLVRD